MSFQQMAKGFGSTVDKLMDTAAKFDSIEEGVQFGTNLNNVLSAVGGSFDSMLASTMNYDDRIKLITQSIANSRDQINSMSEVSQRAYVRQLEQTTGLGGQTIQAILKNNELVNSIDTLTGKQFEQLEVAPIKKMADEFTTATERSNLFMNQYLKVGVRMEGFIDQTTKNVRDVQQKYLGPLAKTVSASRNLADLIKKTSESFASASLTKIVETAKKDIEENAKKLRVALDRGLGGGTTPGFARKAEAPKPQTKAAAKTKQKKTAETPGVVVPPTEEKIPVANPNVGGFDMIRQSVADSTAAAVETAVTRAVSATTRTSTAGEIIIHVRPTEELKALMQSLSIRYDGTRAIVLGTSGT